MRWFSGWIWSIYYNFSATYTTCRYVPEFKNHVTECQPILYKSSWLCFCKGVMHAIKTNIGFTVCLVYFVYFFFLFNHLLSVNFQVCIPKYSSCVKQSITEADVKDHILFPDNLGEEEEENSLYRTLSRKVCTLSCII